MYFLKVKNCSLFAGKSRHSALYISLYGVDFRNVHISHITWLTLIKIMLMRLYWECIKVDFTNNICSIEKHCRAWYLCYFASLITFLGEKMFKQVLKITIAFIITMFNSPPHTYSLYIFISNWYNYHVKFCKSCFMLKKNVLVLEKFRKYYVITSLTIFRMQVWLHLTFLSLTKIDLRYHFVFPPMFLPLLFC